MPEAGAIHSISGAHGSLRKGHDGLAALVQSMLQEDPFTGTVFVFRAKRADRLKILFWDGTGLVMAHKRLEETTFTWPAIKDGLMMLNRARLKALYEPPRVYRRAKLSEICPLWNRHQRRRPRSRIHPSSANARCGSRWNTAMSIKAKLRR